MKGSVKIWATVSVAGSKPERIGYGAFFDIDAPRADITASINGAFGKVRAEAGEVLSMTMPKGEPK